MEFNLKEYIIVYETEKSESKSIAIGDSNEFKSYFKHFVVKNKSII